MNSAAIGWGVVAVVGVLLMAAAGWSVATFGGVQAGLACLAGQEVYVARRSIALGELAVGRTVTVEIKVQSLSATALTLLGAQTDCSCVATAGLPLELSPRSSGIVSVYVTPYPRDAGHPFARQVELLSERIPNRVSVELTGVVLP